jgi:hypothetical protein
LKPRAAQICDRDMPLFRSSMARSRFEAFSTMTECIELVFDRQGQKFPRQKACPLPWHPLMGSLIKKRRKRMRKKKHKKMLKATRWQRRAGK